MLELWLPPECNDWFDFECFSLYYCDDRSLILRLHLLYSMIDSKDCFSCLKVVTEEECFICLDGEFSFPVRRICEEMFVTRSSVKSTSRAS